MSTDHKPIRRDPSSSVYDGQRCLGHIFDEADGCVGTLADCVPIGRFKNWREASAAIHEARADALADAQATRSTLRPATAPEGRHSQTDAHSDAPARP